MAGPAYAGMTPEVAKIQSDWAIANYQAAGDEQEALYVDLIDRCDQLTAGKPGDASAKIWCGIVNSTYAGVAGGLSALKYAKIARGYLEEAIKIEPTALSGAAQTSLGTLYYKVPGWPIGFGSDKKAKKLLLSGIKTNPTGIDSNYFYADFLFENNELKEARKYLMQAKQAQPRQDRPLADKGRHKEIDQLMAAIDKKLDKR
ncbi:MAG: hypothetical protein HOC23_04760 [Halieaceae bacterium]|nr:hypothetical protein [Halieaceae bacterium]